MAADWRTTSAILSYTGYLDGSTKCDGFIKLYLQYDLNSATPTSIKYRFKIDNTKSDGWTNDEYFIFWRPNQKNIEQFFRVKEAKASWPDYSKTLTLTKDWDESNFKLPEFWLCHTGSICNGKTAFTKTDGYLYMTYGDAKTKKIYWYFTNNRQNFKSTKSSYTFPSISKAKATSVGTGTVSITDNGDNSFTLKGTKGASGTNNPSTGPTLSWGYTNSYGNSFSTGDKKTLTIADKKNATRTVYAKSVTGATYGSSKTATASLAVKQYVAPGDAGTPIISYKKNRLTIKENWSYSWTAASRTNSSSPVEGYRIVLLKNGKSIPIVNSSGTIISSNPSSDTWHTVDITGTNITIYPNKHATHKFKANDTVQLGVKSFTKNGKGTQVFNSDYSYSTISTVQNSGVIRVKIGAAWKEGQVFVKVGSAWKEAEVVNTKAGTTWKESE